MRYASTYCSQCGRDFGPGDHGYSHCSSHTPPWVPTAVSRDDGEIDKDRRRFRGVELVREGDVWRTVGALRLGGDGPAMPRSGSLKELRKALSLSIG